MLLLNPATSGSLRDDVGHLELMAHQLVEADALNAFDRQLEAALILGGQETLSG